jgi:hypothetical protein
VHESGGQDYVPIQEALFFPCGSCDGRKICVDIEIITDNAYENTEMFYVRIVAEDADNVVVQDDAVFVYIVDDDGEGEIE